MKELARALAGDENATLCLLFKGRLALKMVPNLGMGVREGAEKWTPVAMPPGGDITTGCSFLNVIRRLIFGLAGPWLHPAIYRSSSLCQFWPGLLGPPRWGWQFVGRW